MKRGHLIAMIGSVGLAGLAACGDDTSCGEGTTEVDGECVAAASVTCGEGTVAFEGECLPGGSAPGTPVTLTAVTSPTPFPGGGLLELTGAGFRAVDGGELTLRIGDQAVAVVATSDTTAVGQLPPASAAEVTVTLANAHGEASQPFQYQGVLTGDGRYETLGVLRLVDPRNGASIDLGPISYTPEGAEGPSEFSISGLAFDASGTLFATSVGNTNVLLTLDPQTGAPTEIGELFDSVTETNHNHIGDIAFVGDRLFGWSNSTDSLVEISTNSGNVTEISSDLDGTGGLALVAQGATDLLCLSSVDSAVDILAVEGPSAGTSTEGVVLQDNDFSNDTAGAARLANGNLLIVTADGDTELLHIDVTTGVVTQRGNAPSQTDAVAIPPGFTASRDATDGVFAPGIDLEAMLPATARAYAATTTAPSARPLQAAEAFGKAAVRGERLTLQAYARAQGLARTGALLIRDAGGRELLVTQAERAAGHLQLQANRRGKLKLVNTQTGQTAMRNIAAVVVQ